MREKVMDEAADYPFEDAVRAADSELDMEMSRRLERRWGGHWRVGVDRFRGSVIGRGARMQIDGMFDPGRDTWVASMFDAGECIATETGEDPETAIERVIDAAR